MSDETLRQLAEEVGFAVHWQNFRGESQQVSVDTLRALLRAMALPCDTPGDLAESSERVAAERQQPHFPPLITGIVGTPVELPAHAGLTAGGRLSVRLESGDRAELTVSERSGRFALQALEAPGYHVAETSEGEVTLAIAPRRAFSIEDVSPDRNLWGLAVQLYSLCRKGDGGAGDFTALAQCMASAAQGGADAVAISPVHALYAADSGHFGPYAPSSRLFFNSAYIDPASLVGEARMHAIAAAAGVPLQASDAQREALIDWPRVASVRLRLLRAIFGDLRARELAPDSRHPWAQQLNGFRSRRGRALLDHARFEAMHAVQVAQGNWAWRDWPERWRNPRSRAVTEFAREHAADVDFHIFLQWLAEHGLAAAQRAGRDAGMHIGLIADLAVGTDGSGSHAWSRQQDILMGVSVGAPPDLINTAGQNWGLTSFSPRALREHAFLPFLETLRATLRHAGGARIDHVLGLQRLWLVPEGAGAKDGAYLRYPLEDMLRLIALESLRHRAIIIGEDLGTVPAGFQDRLSDAGVMGMRVLWFERDHGYFVHPSRWSTRAMATTSTHDLSTVAGWWSGRDIDWRVQLHLLPDAADEDALRAERADDRRALWSAFEYAEVAKGEMPALSDPAPVVDAAVRFVACTPAPLAIVPIEDLLGLIEQPNLPGTTNEHPNWQRRLPGPVDCLLQAPEPGARMAGLREVRHGRSTP